MSNVIPFRLPEPLAVVSIDANWNITLFGHDDCAKLGVIEFAIADQVVSRLFDLHLECWRLVFTAGTRGICDRLCEALRLEASQ